MMIISFLCFGRSFKGVTLWRRAICTMLLSSLREMSEFFTMPKTGKRCLEENVLPDDALNVSAVSAWKEFLLALLQDWRSSY